MSSPSLPVVDETGKLLGIVTVDDALDVMEEESAEDLAIATGSAHDTGTLAGAWWLTLRRSAWAIIWAVVLLGALGLNAEYRIRIDAGIITPAVATGLGFLTWAAVLLPMVLRVAEEVSSRTVAELIGGADAEDRPSLGTRLLRESGLGLALGLSSGALAFGYAYGVQRWYSFGAWQFALATAVTVLVTVLVGSALAELALRRSEAGKRVSGTALAVLSMVIGTAVYLGLSYWTGTLVTAGV